MWSLYPGSIYSVYNELLSNVIKTSIQVIWSLVSLYVTHPNPLLLQQVSFSLTKNRYTLGRNQYHVYSSSATHSAKKTFRVDRVGK